jgi:hypothetical protein
MIIFGTVKFLGKWFALSDTEGIFVFPFCFILILYISREEDEVMGLKFQKDMHLASEQIYPPSKASNKDLSKLQERLVKKLGPNAFPFTFKFPPNSPASVTLQPGPEDAGKPCGVEYFLKAFAGENDSDRSHKR